MKKLQEELFVIFIQIVEVKLLFVDFVSCYLRYGNGHS